MQSRRAPRLSAGRADSTEVRERLPSVWSRDQKTQNGKNIRRGEYDDNFIVEISSKKRMVGR